jgi:hypothetical protein
MGPGHCPEMSALCLNPEEQRSQVHHGKSLTFPVRMFYVSVTYRMLVRWMSCIVFTVKYTVVDFICLLNRLYETIFFTIILYVQLWMKVDNVHQ